MAVITRYSDGDDSQSAPPARANPINRGDGDDPSMVSGGDNLPSMAGTAMIHAQSAPARTPSLSASVTAGRASRISTSKRQ